MFSFPIDDPSIEITRNKTASNILSLKLVYKTFCTIVWQYIMSGYTNYLKLSRQFPFALEIPVNRGELMKYQNILSKYLWFYALCLDKITFTDLIVENIAMERFQKCCVLG